MTMSVSVSVSISVSVSAQSKSVGWLYLNLLEYISAQEWTNRTLISHERTIVHFLVLPGSLLSITEISEYTYISLI